MNNIIEHKKIGKYYIDIYKDPDATNPLEYDDRLVTLACFHKRYRLGHHPNLEWPNTEEGFEEFQTYLKENKDNLIYKPLRLYDHSGLSISTSEGYPYNCKFDSSYLGAAYIKIDRFKKEFGYEEIDKEALNLAIKLINNVVKEYDHYLKGEVYGYVISKEENG